MANIATRQLVYTDDFGVERTVRFKIKAEYADTLAEYDPVSGFVCSSGSNRKMRYLKATNAAGESIQFPVGLRTGIAAAVQTLYDADFICFELVGETVIRFAGIGTPGSAYTIPDGFANKISGTFEYNSDVLGSIRPKFAYEAAPTAIAAAIEECLGPPVTLNDGTSSAICSSTIAGFTPRRFKVVADNSGADLGIISRLAPVGADTLDPTACRTALAAVAVCLGYEGESIKNLQEYIART